MTLRGHVAQRPLLLTLLSLLLLAPLPSLARQAPADAAIPPDSTEAPSARSKELTQEPLPGTSTPAPVRLLDIPEPQRPPAALRVLAELGGVFVGEFVGAFVGFIATDAVYGLTGSVPVGYAAFFLTMGSAMALGAYGGGQLAGGDAWLRGPFLGVLVGCAVGLLIDARIGFERMGPFPLPALLPMALMLPGAIIGYEIAEHGGKPRSVQPLLSVSSRGAVVGLAGTF